jgi:hypothetical protein
MGGRTLCLAIRTVEVDSGRRIGSPPGPVIAGVDPEPAGLGAAAARIEQGIGVSSANSVCEAKTCSASLACSGSSHQTAPPTQLASVDRSSSRMRNIISVSRTTLIRVRRSHAVSAVVEDATGEDCGRAPKA